MKNKKTEKRVVGFCSIDLLKWLIDVLELPGNKGNKQNYLGALLLISNNTVRDMMNKAHWPDTGEKNLNPWNRFLSYIGDMHNNYRQSDTNTILSADEFKSYIMKVKFFPNDIYQALKDFYAENNLHTLVPQRYAEFLSPDERLHEVVYSLLCDKRYSDRAIDSLCEILKDLAKDGFDCKSLNVLLDEMDYENLAKEVIKVAKEAKDTNSNVGKSNLLKKDNKSENQIKLTKQKNHNNKQNVIYCTIQDLEEKYKISIPQIEEQIMANDRALYDFDKSNFKETGTIGQWREHMIATPQCWGFLLCEKTKTIVGNFSYVFLSTKQSQELVNGRLDSDYLTQAYTTSPIGSSEVAIYLLNLSVNSEYDTAHNWQILWENFARSISSWIEQGLLICSIFAAISKPSFVSIYRNYGFECVIEEKNKNLYRALYENSLFNGFPAAFRSHMVKPEPVLSFKQLSYDDRECGVLTDAQLKQISSLVFDSDPYVFPALFESRDHCIDLLPFIFHSNNDTMFCLDNCFVALDEQNRIIGLILHKKGPLDWDHTYFDRWWDVYRRNSTFENSKEAVANRGKVLKEYFTVYNKEELLGPTDANGKQHTDNLEARVLLNFAVHKSLRHNKEIGYKLMESFIATYPDERLYLRAIPEVKHDLDIYVFGKYGKGFELERKTTGFSLSTPKPDCLILVRDPKN